MSQDGLTAAEQGNGRAQAECFGLLLKNYLKLNGKPHQFHTMKKSKVDPHREYIVSKLQVKMSINQICKDLGKKGCSVSRSYLTEWIAASGINYTPLKRGRPACACVFPLLPAAGGDQPSITPPLFLFGLQEGVLEEVRIEFRKQTLKELGLPSISMHPEQWDDLRRYADLSDPELLLLAFLKSDLGAPPFSQGSQPLNDWYCKLVTLSMELREAIATAIKNKAAS